MDSCFVEDGWTVEQDIQGVPGFYGPLKVKYRPSLADDRYELLRQDKTSAELLRKQAEILDRQIEGWDAKNRAGAVVEKNAANIARLHPDLLGRLLDLVLGYRAAQAVADAQKN